jgi:hypothetical protein
MKSEMHVAIKIIIKIAKVNIHQGFSRYSNINLQLETRNVCITKYARLYKLSNGILVMTPK